MTITHEDLAEAYARIPQPDLLLLCRWLALPYGGNTPVFTVEDPWGRPLPGNIRQEENNFKQLRRELVSLQKEEQTRQNRLFTLRGQAKPLWSKPAKVPTVEVKSELEKVARRAHVTLQNVGAPRTTKVTDNITGVELTLRLTGSMRDISLFLTELDKNEPAFFWASCIFF